MKVMMSDLDFKILNTGFFDSRFLPYSHQDGYITKDRLAQNYEIELPVIDGNTAYIDGQAYPIRRRHLLIAKPGQLRHSVLDFQVYYIHLMPPPSPIRALLDGLPTSFVISSETKYRDLLQTLRNAVDRDFEGKNLYINSKMYELLYMMYADSRKNYAMRPANHRSHLEKAKHYIEQNYQQPLQLTDMAIIANLSPSHFHRLFKAYYDETPGSYLQSVRLAAAKEMLLTTDQSVESVAIACGYTSQVYFNAVFKKATGMAPLNFKKYCLSAYGI